LSACERSSIHGSPWVSNATKYKPQCRPGHLPFFDHPKLDYRPVSDLVGAESKWIKQIETLGGNGGDQPFVHRCDDLTSLVADLFSAFSLYAICGTALGETKRPSCV
jgi:hypothetical protein